MGDRWRRGWQGWGRCWVRGAEFSLPQAPLKKLPLRGLLNQGPELEEDVPDPGELDWWSKYYASLQGLQGQVRERVPGGQRRVNGKQKDLSLRLWSSTAFSELFITVIFSFLHDNSKSGGLLTP